MSVQHQVSSTGPSLAETVALAQAGDEIVIEGRVETSPVQIRKPLILRGGTLVGDGALVLGLHADVSVLQCTIENPNGHGVVAMAGAPVLREVRFRVAQTAFACGAAAAPRLEACEASSCAIGFTAQDDVVVQVDGFSIASTGSGMFFTGRASGQVCNIGIVSGGMPAVEIGGEASPELVQIVVALGGGGGFFVHGKARPRVLRSSVSRTQLAAVEVRGHADPIFDGLSVRDCQGSGLFLHETARGTYMALDIVGCGLVSVEVSEKADVELEEGALLDGRQGGIWIRDDAKAEGIGLEVSAHALVGVDVVDRGVLLLDGCEIARNGGGVQVDGGTVRAVECAILNNRGAGVRAFHRGRVGLEGGRLAGNAGLAIEAVSGGAVWVDEEVEVEGEQRADENSVLRIGRLDAE